MSDKVCYIARKHDSCLRQVVVDMLILGCSLTVRSMLKWHHRDKTPWGVPLQRSAGNHPITTQ